MKTPSMEKARIWVASLLSPALQTLGVAFYLFLCLFCSLATSIVLLLVLLYTEYKWIPLLYASWIIYDRNVGILGGRSPDACFVRRWRIWRHYCDYFPIRLVKTAELDSARHSYLLCCHPHGILCCGVFGALVTDALGVRQVFPGLFPRLLTLPLQFLLPGTREVVWATGACSASKRGMERVLEDGGAAPVLVVGGASEALNHDPGAVTLVLNRRKGFVRMALRFGRSLVPVFVFGENFVFRQADNPEGSRLRRFQHAFERIFTFSPPLFYGRWCFLLPFRRPINVVVGGPIHVAKGEPSAEDVERTHAAYVKALMELYETYNPVYGDPKVRLVIQ